MRRATVTMSLIIVLLMPEPGSSQAISDYLILQDIGAYKLDKPEKMFPGEPPSGGPKASEGAGILSGSGHFPDHVDKTYEVMYLGGGAYASPTVMVTQHAGSDSDKWLLHEVEDGYRDDEMATLGLVTEGAILRKIDTNKVFWIGFGGASFTWISNNIVIKVSYTDLQGAKSEPLAVVQAYLQKFPSTIPAAMVLDNAHDIQWIKEEMERRLWLGDKWVAQIQPSDPKLNKKLNAVVKSMNIFLDYREKYYGIAAKDEKNLLAGYLNQNNSVSIQSRLAEYKTWWTSNKGKSISL